MAEEKTSKKVEKGADASKANKKKNPFKSMSAFFKGVNAERKKVVWPTGKETIKNAFIVLVVVIIAGSVIYGVDTLLSLGMKGIKSLATNETTVSETAEDTTEDTTELVEDTTAENADAE